MIFFQVDKKKIYEGHFDGLSNGMVRGWIYDKKNKEETISVDLFINGKFHKTFEAKKFRPDLLAAKKGNHGACSFEIPIDLIPFKTENIKIELFVSGSNRIRFGVLDYPNGRPVTFEMSSNRIELKNIIKSGFDRIGIKLGIITEKNFCRENNAQIRVSKPNIIDEHKVYFEALKNGRRDTELVYFMEQQSIIEPALRCLLIRVWPDTPQTFLNSNTEDLNFAKIMLDFYKINMDK